MNTHSLPFVSVIIPTLNEERYIERCLDSVFRQNYPAERMEVIVLDGGSSDLTVQLVAQLQEQHKNLILSHNPKRTQASAFNLGVEKSKGDIVVRLDAHSLYPTDYVELCVSNHQEDEYGNVGGRWIMKPGSDTLAGVAIAKMNASPFTMGGASFRTGGERKSVDTVPFGSFTRKVLEKVGPMDEGLQRGEDNEFNARIRSSGYVILLDPAIYAYYYTRATLRLFLKQMYDNGFSIGVLIRYSRRSINLRHLIPLAFVLFLIIVPFFALRFLLIYYILIITAGFYLLLNLVFSILAIDKRSICTLPVIFLATPAVHIFYGFGTIMGFIKCRYDQMDP